MINFSKLLKNRKQEKYKASSNNSNKSKRENLIEEAIAIHKKKSRLLDSLDEETRNRLRSVAINKVFKLPENK